MKLLLIGASGQLGQCLLAELNGSLPSLDVWAPSSRDLNLTNPASIEQAITQFSPSHIINAAAFNAVDQAQETIAQAFAVNASGPGFLAQQAYRTKARLLHVSTDYVFDGKKQRSYTEADRPAPLNVYGDSKYQGECAVLKADPSAWVVRTSWLFSSVGESFVKTIVQAALAGRKLRVVHDQVSTPTPTGDLARVLLAIVQSDSLVPGIHHFAGEQALSRYEWARQILICLDSLCGSQYVQRLSAVTAADYGAAAPRPAWSALDSSRLRQWLAEQKVTIPTVGQRLHEVVAVLQQSAQLS